MDKAVLISIRPEWVELIASGRKTLEVRKTRPKLETPFKVYIYCTVGGTTAKERDRNLYTDLRGKVIGEFVCDDCSLLTKDHYGYVEKSGFISRDALNAYMGLQAGRELSYSDGCYGWNISDLMIYDTPRELREFWKPCPEYDELGTNCWDCENRCGDDEVDCNTDGRLYLTRPPQSWCYVEVMT